MKLSIIIPVYNEEKTIAKIIKKVKNTVLPRGVEKEIVVVDDASQDLTPVILSKIKGIKVFRHKENTGKGGAVLTGIKNSEGEVIVIQDADLEYNPKDISRLLKPILEKKSEVVYGSRLKNYSLRIFGSRRTPFLSHYFGNKFLTFITNLLYKANITDMETGYKMFKRKVLDGIELKSKRFEFEPEITAKILKKGLEIHEIPIKIKPRGYKEGKKISWVDGFVAVLTLFRYRFWN